MNKSVKNQKRARRHKKIRAKISGTASRPRFSVFKSNTAIYAQLIDDAKGVTLASARGADAHKVGVTLAKAALAKKINTVVFDRGGYIYTGKIKTLAESARTAGLKF
ncbi:MAG: 50S ribosomal protein L18 [Patescibacteria group bacterium]